MTIVTNPADGTRLRELHDESATTHRRADFVNDQAQRTIHARMNNGMHEYRGYKVNSDTIEQITQESNSAYQEA